jgi:putative hemolysin
MDDTGTVSSIVLNSILRDINPVDVPTLIGLVATLLVLLLFCAICASSENAFFSHRESDLETLRENKNQASRNILYLLAYPKHLLATVLVVNSLCSVAFVVVSVFFSGIILDLEGYPILHFFIEAIVVTLIILIFGEVMPKVYATRNYRKSAIVLSYPMRIFLFLFWPFTNLLVRFGSLLEKKVKQKAPELTPEELSHAIDMTADKSDAQQEKDILKGIVNIGQTQVSQIMKPRMDVMALDDSLNFHQVLEMMKQQRFSRMPVFHENFDEITGILSMKDLLPHLDESSDFEWKKIQRAPYFVPENKKIDDLLHEIRVNRNHMAIVVDEFGGSHGIVTLEDILEEVFGELQDEFDDEAQQYSRLDDNTYLFEGKTPIVDLLRIVHLPINFFDDVNEENDTLGGLITEMVGKIPTSGEEIKYKNLTFYIDSADLRKIKRVKVQIIDEEESHE